MATCRHIVNSALRKLGRLGAGREPRVADQTDTLAALQGLYGSWIAAGTLGRVLDVVPTGTTYTASGNERIYRTSPATLTVELPELLSNERIGDYGHERPAYYGSVITITTVDGITTVDVRASQPVGCVTPPRDGAVVMISDQVGGQTSAWIYDGTIKRWQATHTLQLDNEAPRSAADPEGLSALLALEVADTFGAEVGAGTMRQANRFNVALAQRFGMRAEHIQGVYC